MSSNESYYENRRRRIAQFKNNWGDLQQIDEDTEDLLLEARSDQIRGINSPNLHRRNSVISLHMTIFHNGSKASKKNNDKNMEKIGPSCNSLKKNTTAESCSDLINVQNELTNKSDQNCNYVCDCKNNLSKLINCKCNEAEDKESVWFWDEASKSSGAIISDDGRDVYFHSDYSHGTAAVRGNKILHSDYQHFWEVQLTSPLFGTDMMIGIGTDKVNLSKNEKNFISMLGEDAESWGVSYDGTFHHNNECRYYAQRFQKGTVIGVHLDTWNGNLSFYNNGQPLGLACKGQFKDKSIYPIISSTAARSCMKLVRSKQIKNSLQYICCLALRKSIPAEQHVLDVVKLPPGLQTFLRNNADWLLAPYTSSLKFENKRPLKFNDELLLSSIKKAKV